MRFDERIKEALQAREERKVAEKEAISDALRKFERFARAVSRTVLNEDFKRDGKYFRTVLRKLDDYQYNLILRGYSKNDILIAAITKGISPTKDLWKINIAERGEHHTFSDGTKEIWFRDLKDPRIPELQRWIEDVIVNLVGED